MIELSNIKVGGKSYPTIGSAIDALAHDLNSALDRASAKAVDGLSDYLGAVVADVKEKHSDPWPLSNDEWGSIPGQLALRSGKGVASVVNSANISLTPGGASASIRTALLAIHETGGTVCAKSHTYMALPLRAALDSRGMPLRSGPRLWDHTFTARTKRGNLVIFRKEGRKVTPLYLLRESVYIPKRLGLAEIVDNRLGYFEAKMLAAYEKELLG